MVANKLGSENVTVNCEYTKKNCTKLSFIANTDKIILSITPYDIANKEIDSKVIEVKENITNLTKEIHHIDNNLTIVKEKTNEKVNNVNNFGNVELVQLLTARYN